MKRSLMAIALAVCASLAAASYHAVVAPIAHAWRTAKNFALDALKFAGERVMGLTPASVRIQFKAFVQRIQRRERFLLTSSWKMCPSI